MVDKSVSLATKWGKRLGIICMSSAILLNPLVIEYLFSADRNISSVIIKSLLLLLEIILFFFGMLLYMRPDMLISRWKEILIFLIISLICFLVLDLVFLGSFTQSKICMGFDKELGWDNKKNCQNIFTAPEYKTKIMTNSWGMREIEEFNLTTEKYRIALIGDSFVWGTGVQEDERFGEQLQKLLGDQFEVMNFGVVGYGTDQELLKTKKDVVQFKPQIIIVHFFLNDLENIQALKQYGKNKPRYTLENGSLSLGGYPLIKEGFGVNPFNHITFLLAFLSERFFPPKEGHQVYMQELHINLLKKENTLIDVFALNHMLYHEINKVAKENNSSVVLVNIPAVEQFISQEDLQEYFNLSIDEIDVERTGKALEHAARDLNITYVDLYPILKKQGGIENYFTQDTHLNQKGNQIVAKEIYNSIVTKIIASSR